MITRPDLVPGEEQGNLEVIQLTEEAIPSSHIYMEAQIFTPDSRRLVVLPNDSSSPAVPSITTVTTASRHRTAGATTSPVTSTAPISR